MKTEPPGAALETDGKIIVLLPGPPSEMEPMFCDQVRHYLEGKTGRTFFSRTVHLFGIGESAAEEQLRDLMESSSNPTIAPYAKTGEVLLRVTAAAPDREQALRLLAPAVEKIQKETGAVYLWHRRRNFAACGGIGAKTEGTDRIHCGILHRRRSGKADYRSSGGRRKCCAPESALIPMK